MINRCAHQGTVVQAVARPVSPTALQAAVAAVAAVPAQSSAVRHSLPPTQPRIAQCHSLSLLARPPPGMPFHRTQRQPTPSVQIIDHK
jgi:hypothetical protein